MNENFLSLVSKTLKNLQKGKGVVIMDDFKRENEADVVFPAQSIDENKMALLIRHCSGIVCLCIEEERRKKLKLPMMVNNNSSHYKTPFTVSIEAAKGVTTGVSAKDRVTTILAAINQDAKHEDIRIPGHVFPLVAHPKGLLERQGHTEASITLMKLANLKPYAVICELMNDDGTMMTHDCAKEFAEKHDMTFLKICDIVEYIKQNNVEKYSQIATGAHILE